MLRPGLWKGNQLPNYFDFYTIIFSVAFRKPSFRYSKRQHTKPLEVAIGGCEASEKLFRSSGGVGTVSDVESIKSAILEKPARRDTHTTVFKFYSCRRTNIRLVIAVALSVFLFEAFVMVAIHPLYDLSLWLVAFIDAFILVLVLSPVLYVFVFRPMVRHVNEREQAEQALLESEMQFRTVFRTSPDSITISRLEDGRIVNINDGFTELSGYAREDVLGRSVLDIPLWNDADKRAEMIAGLQKDGQVNNFEAKFKHKDGRLVDGLISARVITLCDGPHILAVSRDIRD